MIADNGVLSSFLREMSLLLELDGASPYRVRAYRKAAQFAAAHHRPLAALSLTELSQLPHIGSKMAAHIAELAQRGSFFELTALRAKLPPELVLLAQAHNMGPRRARELYLKLGVTSPGQLKQAALEGRLKTLPAFGEKLETAVLGGGVAFDEPSPRLLWWDAMMIARELVKSLSPARVDFCEIAGSLRRGEETTGNINLVCAGAVDGSLTSFFTSLPQVQTVVSVEKSSASVQLKAGLRCDLRVAPPELFGAALLQFTGSAEHTKQLCQRACGAGFELSENGLCSNGRVLAARTEEEIYARLGLQFIPPELRAADGEIEAAAAGLIPRLVEDADIKGDFHNHTVASDGHNTLEEMASAAKTSGWHWVALGDHTRSLGVARGLSAEEILAGQKHLAEMQSGFSGLRLFRSAEVEILRDGSLDFTDEELARIDVVAVSVHSFHKMPAEQMTERILRAVKNPHVDILSHPTGRLIGRRPPYVFDEEKVFSAAAKANTALEINGQPERQDLCALSAKRAHAAGAFIALSTDAHSTAQLGFMSQAVKVARRAGLTRDDILNCLSADEIVKRFK